MLTFGFFTPASLNAYGSIVTLTQFALNVKGPYASFARNLNAELPMDEHCD